MDDARSQGQLRHLFDHRTLGQRDDGSGEAEEHQRAELCAAGEERNAAAVLQLHGEREKRGERGEAGEDFEDKFYEQGDGKLLYTLFSF